MTFKHFTVGSKVKQTPKDKVFKITRTVLPVIHISMQSLRNTFLINQPINQ